MNKQTASATADKAPLHPSPTSGAGAKTADSIAESVQTLVDQGAETLDTIKARVAEATDGARTRGAQLVDRTSELVTAHPIKSLAIAFGLGYVAMRITTSKLTSIAMIGGVIYAGSKLVRS
jgi:ElaB/YqjD/DUF883 family membrane-anchored ribosome-binding protein